MTIEQKEIIDFVSVNKDTGVVELTISDHLDWEGNKNPHLIILQDKINTYIDFIESGELYKKYPDTVNRKIIIQVFGKYPLSKMAENFYSSVNEVVKKTGLKLSFIHSKE